MLLTLTLAAAMQLAPAPDTLSGPRPGSIVRRCPVIAVRHGGHPRLHHRAGPPPWFSSGVMVTVSPPT